MSKSYILPYLFAFALMTSSCTGVKNMSGTLSKSDGGRSGTDYSARHSDYLKEANGAKVDSSASRSLYKPVMAGAEASPGARQDVYKKDYARITDGKAGSLNAPGSFSGNSVQDYNQKVVNQYAEMDRLGDVILYELDIIERRYTSLLEQYKTSNNQDRDAVARELDVLNANQLTLYKSYTTIYKNGRNDWPQVKAQVETMLLNLRGIEKK